MRVNVAKLVGALEEWANIAYALILVVNLKQRKD